jgi:hypothetical protein
LDCCHFRFYVGFNVRFNHRFRFGFGFGFGFRFRTRSSSSRQRGNWTLFVGCLGQQFCNLRVRPQLDIVHVLLRLDLDIILILVFLFDTWNTLGVRFDNMLRIQQLGHQRLRGQGRCGMVDCQIGTDTFDGTLDTYGLKVISTDSDETAPRTGGADGGAVGYSCQV